MTIPELQKCKREQRKITVVTAYDALFTRLAEQAGHGRQRHDPHLALDLRVGVVRRGADLHRIGGYVRRSLVRRDATFGGR